MKIPVPGRGYWQKKKSGQPMQPKVLPPLAEGKKDVVTIRRPAPPAGDDAAKEYLDSENLSDHVIVVEGTLAQPHPLVAKTRGSLLNARADNYGLLKIGDSGCIDVKVGKGSLNRALRIMDALIKELDGRGFTVSVDEKGRTMATVLGETVAFAIEEILDREERPLSKAQEKDKERNPWRYRSPEYDYSPSGKLSLKITNPSWDIGRRKWSDGKKQRVEHGLTRFVAALVKLAVIEREHRIRHEQWERERKEEERRRQEWERRKKAEERKLWALFTDAMYWQRSQQIRAYIQAIKDAAERTLESIEPGSPLEEWIAWATKQADRLDPLAPFSYCTEEDRHDDPSPYHSSPKPTTDSDLSWQRLLARSDYFERSKVWWAPQERW